jgi:succinate dehydrogenase / fumarate reductase, cytochrome b subunit
MTSQVDKTIPSAFVWRRLHSLMGLWLVIFLIQHLFVNSQAALFIGDDGKGFINAANALEDLPYLKAVELLFLGLPILIHTVWGIKYLLTAKYNSFGNDGHEPYLPAFERNHAYTWQRITAWVLIIGIAAHVIHMRFIEYPISTEHSSQEYYMVRVLVDPGLNTLAERLNVKLYDEKTTQQAEKDLSLKHEQTPASTENQAMPQKMEEIMALKERPLKEGQAIAVAKDFGTAELLMVRETFKMPIMIVLYTLFVFVACYHAFNGLWTFMIKWGVTLSQRSQRWMLKVATGLMVFIGLLGLSAIWLTYWINLKQ